jgi:hypothetical protein
LASGVAFIASLALALIAALNGNWFVVLLSLSLAGSLLAFLFFNFHPAQVFLGDTGSLFIGFALATIALMGCVKESATYLIVAPILALGFPIFETLISMLRRFIRGRPVFVGDRYHTHHRLLNLGLSHRQVALILYTACFACMAAALLYQVRASDWGRSWIAIGLYLATVCVLALLAGYIRPREALEKAGRRRRNKVLNSLARYVATSIGSGNSLLSPVEILRITRREMNLRFLEIALEDGSVLYSSGRIRFQPTEEQLAAFRETPQLLVHNGTPRSMEKTGPLADLFEETVVQTQNACRLIVRYQYSEPLEELERQDISACLADLFEKTRMRPGLGGMQSALLWAGNAGRVA